MVDAFSKDPLLKAIDLEYEEITRMYEIPIRVNLRYGKVFASSENFEGIIAYSADKYTNMTTWNLIRSGAILPALKLKKKLGKFMQEMTELLEEHKNNLNIGPYIYLSMIGVSQKFQGRGFGGKMLRALIEKAVSEGQAIYLETQTEENVSLYKKFGFEIIKEFIIPELNLPMWEMVRRRS